MIVVLTLAGSTPAVMARQERRTQRETYTQTQFDELFKQVSNWGRWGKNDQLGTLNLITPERKREAAKLVREGVSVSLARDLNTEMSIDNPDPFRDTMTLGVDGKFNMDTYTVNFHGFAFSHVDALSHTYYKGYLYNGFPDTSITTKGASVLDTAAYRDGNFCAGSSGGYPVAARSTVPGKGRVYHRARSGPLGSEDRCTYPIGRRGGDSHWPLVTSGFEGPVGHLERISGIGSFRNGLAAQTRRGRSGERCRS